MSLILAGVAIILAAIDLIRYRGESLTGWAVLLLGIAFVFVR